MTHSPLKYTALLLSTILEAYATDSFTKFEKLVVKLLNLFSIQVRGQMLHIIDSDFWNVHVTLMHFLWDICNNC